MAKKKMTLEEKMEEAIVTDVPYEVPGNWVWIKIGSIVDVVSGGTPKSNVNEYYENGDVAWITPADLSRYNDIYISRGKRNISKLGLEKSSAKLMPKDSVLMSSRAPIGYVAIAENEISTNQGFKSFLPSQVYLPKYLYFYLKYSKDLIETFASGTTFLELSGAKAKIIPFPIPPLKEQQRIVYRIESLFEKLDKAKELIEEAREGFEKRKNAILEKAFTGNLVECKYDEWQNTNLGEISTLITKGASPKWQGIEYVEDKNQTLFITSENVREGYLDLAKEKYLQNEFNEKQKRSVLKQGDILLNIVGASIGRACIYQFDKLANINQAVALIRTDDRVIDKFINYYLNSVSAKKYYMQNKVDVARANLSLKDVSNIPILLPTLEEQKEIVRILDEFLKEESKIEELTQLEEQIELIKKSILAKAFRGDLGTNCEEDESALELLKEILSKS